MNPIKESKKLTLPGKVSEPAETMLTNLGNQVVDVTISGTDLVSDTGVIARELQKWSLNHEFDYETEGYPLIEEAQLEKGPLEGCADLSLPVQNSHADYVSVYWKVLIPKGQKSDQYIGTVSFNPAEDMCLPMTP